MRVAGRPSATGGTVSTFAWYVGIDWGAEEHVLCVVDATGRRVGLRTVAHTADAVQAAIAWLGERTGVPPAAIAVGIERPRGVLVDTFLEHGFAMFAINPKQLDRFRDRFTAGGAKDDARDAHVVADGLRTDPRAFHRIQPDDPAILQLRESCQVDDELRIQVARLTNRLREQLYRVDAAWLTFSPAADDPWLWTVLGKLPHPQHWRRLGPGRLTTMLRTHQIRRVTAPELITALRQPRLRIAPGVADAVATHIAVLIPQLQLLHAQRKTAGQQIDHWLEVLASSDDASGQPRGHRDVVILRSLPGVGRMVAATMLTEATGPLAARDYPTLRAHGGTAPITQRSGKRIHHVHMRYACKPSLRQACYHWARTSIQQDAAARAYYDALRHRGHGHARALRSVADRWLRILVAMLRAQTVYDPARFAATSEAA
jgi:transposase